MKRVIIKGEYITLGQFLKFTGIINSGAMAKQYLVENKVYVNDDLETRRGKKLYENYQVEVNNTKYIIGKEI